MTRPYRRTLAALSLVLALGAALPAQAADGDGRFVVKGVGVAPCATFVEKLGQPTYEKYLFAGWINGYLTAQNQLRGETYDLAPWQSLDTLAEYLRRYCADNPQVTVFDAVSAMADELMALRVAKASDQLRVDHGGESVMINRTVLDRVEERLVALGLLDAVKGTFDAETAKAIAAFQKQRGFPETGLPDQVTLHALLVNLQG